MDPVAPLSSPVTKTYSRTGVSPAAKQRENDAFDLMVTGASATLRLPGKQSPALGQAGVICI